MNGVTPDTPRTDAPATSPATRRVGLVKVVGFVVIAAAIGLVSTRHVLRAQTELPRPTLGSGADAAPAATEPLADVRIEGNRTIPASAIGKYIKSRPGRPATAKQIREDVRALYGTRWFFSIEPRTTQSTKGPVLVFNVVERPIVRAVEFRGASKKHLKHLIAETGLKVGSAYDPTANRESARRIERYYREKGYHFAKATLVEGGDPKQRNVIFEIEEGPKVRVTGTRFLGNEFVSAAVLRLQLQTKRAFLWRFGGKYEPGSVTNDLAALKRYYHGLGFFDVDIQARPVFSDSKANVTIEYKVAEGPRYKIREVEFVGNEIFSEAELREEMNLAPGEFFNERDLNKDVSEFRGRYGELGRIFAKVEAVPRFLETPGEADIVFRIDEDRPYRIRRINVNIQGEHPYTQRHVAMNYLTVAPGMLANADEIDFSRRRLAGTRVFDKAPGRDPQIDVVPVEPDETSAIRQVSARGMAPGWNIGRTPDWVRPAPRRDTIDLDARDPLALERLDVELEPEVERLRYAPIERSNGESREELEQTSQYVPLGPDRAFAAGEEPVFRAQGRGIDQFTPNDYRFDNDPSEPVFGSSPIAPPGAVPYTDTGLVDLNLSLNEAQTGRLMFGVGVNSDSGVVGTISLQEDNFDLFRPPRKWSDWGNGAFRGGGQRFRAEAVPGSEVSRYLVSWTDPFVFGSNYSLSVSGYYFTRFYRDWDEQRAGGRVSVGRVIGTNWTATATYRIEDVEITDPFLPTPPSLAAVVGTSLLQTGGVGVAYDRRDSPFLPTEGVYYSSNYEQAFGDFDFSKVTGEARHYYTTYERADGRGRHVLSVGGEVGWSSDDTPVFERFYAGGFQTFRGFDFRGVSPVEGGVRVGGNWSFLGTAEYKVPLTADENLAVVAFTDFGTVEDDAGFADFRLAVGTGMRITVPAMGPVPLAFDFAIPLADQDFDDKRVFSFYIGITR